MTISLQGMGFVFLVLIVLSISIVGLGWLDRRTESRAATDVPPAIRADAPSDQSVSPEIVAAIGAALALAQADEDPPDTPTSSDSRPAPGWFASGLARQLEARTRQSIRRSR